MRKNSWEDQSLRSPSPTKRNQFDLLQLANPKPHTTSHLTTPVSVEPFELYQNDQTFREVSSLKKTQSNNEYEVDTLEKPTGSSGNQKQARPSTDTKKRPTINLFDNQDENFQILQKNPQTLFFDDPMDNAIQIKEFDTSNEHLHSRPITAEFFGKFKKVLSVRNNFSEENLIKIKTTIFKHFDDLVVPSKDILLGKVIGKGASSHVHYGTYQFCQVAIKKIQISFLNSKQIVNKTVKFLELHN